MSLLSIQITDPDVAIALNRVRTIVRNTTSVGPYPSFGMAPDFIDASGFNSQATRAPTTAPTAPTFSPTAAPTLSPTNGGNPTLYPSPTTAAPTLSPTKAAFGVIYGQPEKTDMFYYTYSDPASAGADIGISGTHANANTSIFRVYLTVTHGTLTLLRIPASVKLLHGSGFQEDTIILSGSLREVNTCLRGMTFLPDQNWNSAQSSQLSKPYRDFNTHGASLGASMIKTVADINVTVVDHAGLRTEDHAYVYIRPTNDAPVLTLGPVTPHDR